VEHSASLLSSYKAKFNASEAVMDPATRQRVAPFHRRTSYAGIWVTARSGGALL